MISRMEKSVRAVGIDLDAIKDNRLIYNPDPAAAIPERFEGYEKLDPYLIGEMFVDDLLQVVMDRDILTNDRQRNLHSAALEIVRTKSVPSAREFRNYLSKENKLFFSGMQGWFDKFDYNDPIPASSRQFNSFDFSAIRASNPCADARRAARLMGREFADYTLARDLAVSEMILALQSAGAEHKKLYDDMSMFWSRFQPIQYDFPNSPILEQSGNWARNGRNYSASIPLDIDELQAAVAESGSCIGGMSGVIKNMHDDPGTIMTIHTIEGAVSGYMRAYLARTDKHEPVLAIDALETRGSSYPFIVMSMSLSAMCLAMKSGVKYIIGKEGRIAGPRSGFGGKYMKMNLKKLGRQSGLYSYAFPVNHLGCNQGCSFNSQYSLLFNNWRR